MVPLTAPDAPAGQIEAIVVNLDWKALLHRQGLRAAVTLIKPDMFMVMPTSVDKLGRSTDGLGAIEPQLGAVTALDTLQIEAGRLTLQAPSADDAGGPLLLTFRDIQAIVHRPEASAPVTFEVTGEFGQGRFQARGTATDEPRSLQVTAAAQNLSLNSLNSVLPATAPIQAGTLNGTVSLKGEVPNALDLSGRAMIQGGQMQLGQSPAPIDDLQSTLSFNNQRLTLSDTKLHLGPMTLTVAGILDRAGYDLTAQTSPVAAADLRPIVGDRIPLEDAQSWQGIAQITGSGQELIVKLQPDSVLSPPGRFTLDLGMLGIAQGLQALGLPARDWISPIEGATYQFGADGAWFTLSDGTVVPPLSEAAYQQAQGMLGSNLPAAFDRKFFWFLQTNPYVTAIAADLARGRLLDYRQGNRFDTDRFFLEYFVPVYVESSRAAGLDPGEALWMLDHSLRTLHDPLLRHPNAQPVTAGSGTVGSFWSGEQLLSMQQLLT
ncbi:MAG: DUF748 domain-containing protein, partial [Nodosilinea sp.]